MKTRITAFISLLLSMMLLVSCSQPVQQQQDEVDESAAAKAVVEQFADDVMTLDGDKIADNLASSFDRSGLDALDAETIIKNFSGAGLEGIDEDTVDAVKDILKDIFSDKIKIAVGEPKADGDNYTVPFTLSMPDFNSIKQPSESEILSLFMDAFGDASISDLVAMVSSGDSSDITKFITSHKEELKTFVNKMLDMCLDDVDDITQEAAATVVKENGKWKISELN